MLKILTIIFILFFTNYANAECKNMLFVKIKDKIGENREFEVQFRQGKRPNSKLIVAVETQNKNAEFYKICAGTHFFVAIRPMNQSNLFYNITSYFDFELLENRIQSKGFIAYFNNEKETKETERLTQILKNNL